LKCFRPFVASWPAPSASGRSESGRVGISPTGLVHLRQGTHNNRLENCIRPFVLGRKGWLFSDTVPGARASANLYSLVETAKANHLEPHAYLSLLFAQLPHAKTVEDFERLLPWNVRAQLPITHLYSRRAEHQHVVS
jgi:IS66 C-terminal element/Transposase IS66 family